MLLFILGLHSITYTCDSNISFLFLQLKFGFNRVMFSNIQSVRMLMAGFGSLLLIFMINFTDMNVLVIGLIGTISRLGYYLEYALACKLWVLYLGNSLGAFGGTIPAVCKIIMARIVDPSDLGKLNTFVALIEALLPLAFVPIFDQVWKLTSSVWPGLSFLITSGVLFIILIMFTILSTIKSLKEEKY